MTEPYRHRNLDGSNIDLPVGKVVCVGRNYAAHARELNNPVPTSPILFIKPSTALVPLEMPFTIPTGRGEVHHELEIALLIGHSDGGAPPNVAGVGLALDLTLREVQQRLKKAGQPWEIAKGFDGACPCSAFAPGSRFSAIQDITFSLQVNEEKRQRGNTADMIFPVDSLLQAIGDHFSLQAGDIVLTGTPSGVSSLHAGDALELALGNNIHFSTTVLSAT